MSGIIKSDFAGERVRAVFLDAAEPETLALESQGDPELAASRTEIERLAAIVKLRDADLDRLKREIDKARRDGEMEGRKAGFAEGARHADKALAALSVSCKQACEQLTEDLRNLERLAALLAQEALERVLGPSASQMTLVAQIIKRQVELVGAQSVLSVAVSSKDFAADDLARLHRQNQGTPIEAKAADDIESGGCRIRLRMGSLDVGPRQQWTALKAELSKMAAPSAHS